MPTAPQPADSTPTGLNLRHDLTTIVAEGQHRPYRIVIDEVAGRFTRIADHVWQQLQSGSSDPALMNEATAAGWTQTRTVTPHQRFSPLYFRIRLGSVDALATRLAETTNWLFSAPAIALWTTFIVIALAALLSRFAEVSASLGSLQLFLQQASPTALMVTFIGTKTLHELAHATMCRRLGNRCGDVGILMLCGMPCPYCDVTEIWREPSTVKRAAVMAAGIYVELIVAAIATFVWIFTHNAAVGLFALNLIVICGFSTIVFNANPLMRYDGYYILNDLCRSTNLRLESLDAFRGTVVRRLAGQGYLYPVRRDSRGRWLSLYHCGSAVYRIVVSIMIAGLLLSIADYMGLRRLAVVVVVLGAGLTLFRSAHRIVDVARGRGAWNATGAGRRYGITAGISVLIVAALCMPLPRYRTATGWIDVQESTSVYLPPGGVISSVEHQYGDQVLSGDRLAALDHADLVAVERKSFGRSELAQLRYEIAGKRRLKFGEHSESLSALKEGVKTYRTQYDNAKRDLDECNVRAPISGIVLPPTSTRTTRARRAARSRSGLFVTQVSSTTPANKLSMLSLKDSVGTVSADQVWCRISPNGRLEATLTVNADDGGNISKGSSVAISLDYDPGDVIYATVTDVSEIQHDDQTVARDFRYFVTCQLPQSKVRSQQLLKLIDGHCRGVFHLPWRTLAGDIGRWATDFLGE